MTTLLVANRGEIARRIFRTARRMGIRTVAIYSDADTHAPFVREADAAVRIGPAPARESYLAIDRIVAAARDTGAELVHPGYGFLSEQAAFAEAVEAAGLRFVGPPAEVLRLAGDKAAAKEAAERAGVPVLPGYRGTDQRDEAFVEAARAAGYPVMVKPAAGGGGIGMQLVADEAALRDALARARRIAATAFGDERLILERAVARPRHVEIQILADASGRIATFTERDCSAQRRHQKIVEESPSPAVKPALRTRLREAAVAVARAVGYRNAGTVEFVLDEAGAYFFLEVNARLQVEHPVTEAIHGIDLVEQQLRIALGERVAAARASRGTAVEARVYAEDPAGGFVPSTGRLVHVRWPDGIRVDAGYEEGSLVSRHYDPLLAKLIAHGDDRAAALESLARALDETEVLGVRTNLGFLSALVAHPAMREGRVDTDLVERELGTLAPHRAAAPDEALAVAAVASVAPRAARDPWGSLGSWRVGVGLTASVHLRDGADERTVRVEDGGHVDGSTLVALDEPHRWALDGEAASAAADGSVWWVGWRGATYELDAAPRDRTVDTLAGAEVVAPMPGTVLAVHARAAQPVRRGELLCVVEAMKMELRIEAPGDGVVTRVLVAAGDRVERGQRLMEFESAG